MSRVKQSRVHASRPRTARRATLAGRLADQERIRKGRDVRYDSPVRTFNHTTAKGRSYGVTRQVSGRGKYIPGQAMGGSKQTEGITGQLLAAMSRFKRQKV